MGDKYYGHTIGSVVEEINIEPLARDYDETSLHPVYAFDSISDNNISHPDTTVKNKEKYEYLIDFKEKKGNNRSHTIKNNLRPTGYQPFGNKISQPNPIVNTNSMQNSKEDAAYNIGKINKKSN